MSEAGSRRTLVIGLGNPLMADDGVGLRALARLAEAWIVPPEVELVDGGTWGMNLLHRLEEAEGVIFLDAINARQAPGTEVILERGDLPRYFALKLSPHQIDLREVLALMELRGTLPGRIVALGLQPDVLEMSTSISPLLEARIDGLVGRAVDRLEAWGHDCRPREVAAHA